MFVQTQMRLNCLSEACSYHSELANADQLGSHCPHHLNAPRLAKKLDRKFSCLTRKEAFTNEERSLVQLSSCCRLLL